MTKIVQDRVNHGASTGKGLGFSVLLLWIAVLSFLLISGKYPLYILPGLWPLLVVGIILLMMAFFAYCRAGSGAESERRTAWVRSGLLILPLIYLSSVHGESLGVHALNKRMVKGMMDPTLTSTLDPLNFVDGETLALDLHQISGNHQILSGRSVATIGQVAHDPSLPGGFFILFRFVINCCVADARPVALMVQWNEGDLPQENDWIEIEGRLIVKPVADRIAVVIIADILKPVERPREIYLTDGSL
ncbi:MAG: TIGR03943 family protein [Planctomycetes bacterium]|nr:TIGR03943 family protein [Planctomycetota bacterium]